ncbi:MAG: winged helix-turn-helix domain-containing protein [Candidatus Ranarchaeia archaeon]
MPDNDKLNLLSNPLRLKILHFIQYEAKPFSIIQKNFETDRGQLAYHLRKLSDYIQQNKEGHYSITSKREMGLKIIEESQNKLHHLTENNTKNHVNQNNTKIGIYIPLDFGIIAKTFIVILVLVGLLMIEWGLSENFEYILWGIYLLFISALPIILWRDPLRGIENNNTNNHHQMNFNKNN